MKTTNKSIFIEKSEDSQNEKYKEACLGRRIAYQNMIHFRAVRSRHPKYYNEYKRYEQFWKHSYWNWDKKANELKRNIKL